MIEFYYHL